MPFNPSAAFSPEIDKSSDPVAHAVAPGPTRSAAGFPKHPAFIVTSILLSGLAWYAAFDLSGHWGWLIFLAPIPVLYTSLYLSTGKAFLTVAAAFLTGRLSWLPYLLSVIPPIFAIVFTLALPLAFALMALPARRLILRSNPILAAITLPTLYTAIEFAFSLVSRDGTIASIAYTQAGDSFFIQIASLTGIWGITWFILFVPAAITIALYRKNFRPLRGLAIFTAIVLTGVTIYSTIRLGSTPATQGPAITTGLVSIPESEMGNTLDPRAGHQIRLAGIYMSQICQLANRHADIILLPEKALPVGDSTEKPVRTSLAALADSLHVHIIVGYTRLYKDHKDNGIWAFGQDGHLQADYKKIHLFEGEMFEQFRPGSRPGLFMQNGRSVGVAICKDLDFDRTIRLYSQGNPIQILYVPAWDFGRDGWLHSRIAYLRAVENGCWLVRNARQGRLTVSDPIGRTFSEASSEDGGLSTLVTTFAPYHIPTRYARIDIFGWIDLLAAICLLAIPPLRRRIPTPS